ncbi:hypothetical protein INT45_010158 [Circinella minor]|uniref:Uncharacterized protein n=1 Tax=Circinella minor TaxID=1195481 RepID=A0A8H7SCJ1_9FUNG|nr:hypothetical protein INT45_010158 [Circinella minor]
MSLSLIIDVAHKHNKEFMKQVISERWSYELGSKQVEVRQLDYISFQIIDTVPAFKDQPHEALKYLAKMKVEILETEYDCQGLQIIDVMEYLVQHLPSGTKVWEKMKANLT